MDDWDEDDDDDEDEDIVYTECPDEEAYNYCDG